MKIAIIVPAFNEAPVISQTLLDIKEKTKKISNTTLVLVDDGSSDETYQKAQKNSDIILRHLINRGLGGAIGTGLRYVKENNFDIAVTIDADGQHDANDIHSLIQPILDDKADVVIGTRLISSKGSMPIDRKILVTISNILTQVLFGRTTTDTLSGFRAFNKKAIQEIQIKTDRMEVSNELFSEIRRLKLKVAEVPIKIIYTDYSRAKGQSNSDAFNVVFKLVLRLFR